MVNKITELIIMFAIMDICLIEPTLTCTGLTNPTDSIDIINYLSDPNLNSEFELILKSDSTSYLFSLDLTNSLQDDYPEHLAWKLSYTSNQGEQGIIYTKNFEPSPLKISFVDIDNGIIPSCKDKTQCTFKIIAFHLYSGKAYLTTELTATLSNSVTSFPIPVTVAQTIVSPEDIIPCLNEKTCVVNSNYKLDLVTCDSICDKNSKQTYGIDDLIWVQLDLKNNLTDSVTDKLSILSYSFEFYSNEGYSNLLISQVIGDNKKISKKSNSEGTDTYGLPVNTIKDYIQSSNIMSSTKVIKLTVVISLDVRILLSQVAQTKIVFSSKEILVSNTSQRQLEVLIISLVIGVVILALSLIFIIQAIKRKKITKEKLQVKNLQDQDITSDKSHAIKI